MKIKIKMDAYIKLPVLILTMILLLASCSTNVEDLNPVPISSEPVFITGKILNPTPGNNTLIVNVTDIVSGNQSGKVSLVDGDGNFQIRFNLYYSQDVWVSYGVNSFPLIVHPRDSIHVIFDANDLSDKDRFAKSVQFFGDAVNINTNLMLFNSQISKVYMPHNQFHQYEKDFKPDDFVAVLDSLRSVQDEVANEFIKQYNIPLELEKWIKNEIKLDYYNKLAMYVYNHAQFNSIDHKTVVPSSFYDFMNIQFPNGMLHNSRSSQFVGNYLFYRVRAFSKKYATNSLIGYLMDRKGTYFGSLTEQNIEVIKDITEDKFLKEILITRCLYNGLDSREINEFEAHYTMFKKTVFEPFLTEPIVNEYIKIKRYSDNPKITENSSLIPTVNTPANELMKKILDEHKEQIVYLDIWATWCSPCRKEMPYSRQLMNELDSDKIDFVYLCIDSKEDTWKALISEMEIEGSHYLATPDQSRFIYELFEMSGVPQYVLINRMGSIVEKGSYLRPSENAIRTEILNLLNE